MAGLLKTFRKTPINWSAGTLYSPDCNLFKVSIKNAGGTAIDLRAEDDAINTGTNPQTDTAVFEAVEVILGELSPTAYFTVDDASGVMYLVMPKGINDKDELQTRIRNIGKDADPATTTSIGPNDVDISGSIVETATGMTFTV